MDWDRIKPLLEAKLDGAHVKKGGGNFGPKGDYLEGWFVIQEANRIFGHGGWSYTINLDRDDLREVEVTKRAKNGNEWKEMQWQAAYTCVCRLVVGGVTREDVGFGSGFAKSIGDAIEGATKEAATDALKRCLRTFGNPFGLALYDKSRENVDNGEPERPAPKPPLSQQAAAPAQRTTGQVADDMIAHLRKTKTADDLDAVWKDAPFLADYAKLKAKAPAQAARVDEASDLHRGGLADPVILGEHRLDGVM